MFIDLRERVKCQLAASHTRPGDGTPHRGVCPDWESNLQPFDVWNNALIE